MGMHKMSGRTWAVGAYAAVTVVGVGFVTWGAIHYSPRQPEALPTGTTSSVVRQLRDDAEVIGVVFGGRVKAYSLKALKPAYRHVYHDVVGGRAVTVTYCDLGECVRVYTGPDHDLLAGIEAAGVSETPEGAKMLLRVGDGYYEQETGRPVRGDTADHIPLDEVTFTRTSWGKWRELHPDSELYSGG